MWPRRGEVRYLLNGAFYTLAWGETGNPAAPPVVCVHDLTRTGRDFDALADALADRFRVVCPDLPGRGRSQWLGEPSLYEPASYVQALSHLLGVLERPVAWVGTGLGGILGMVVASSVGQPITRLVLNDAGPFIPSNGLARVRELLRQPTVFPDMPTLERRLRALHGMAGRLTDTQWAHLARYSARLLPDGRVAFHYDPALVKPIIETPPHDQHLWAFWDRIRVPVLVLRGEASDLLDPITLARMEQAGASSLTVPDTGHAPALMDAATIGAVRRFLLDR